MKKHGILMGAAVMLASLAHGQKDSLLSPLDNVTVTANRLPQKQSQTGKVVSVITKAELEKAAGKSLAQLLNEQAGVTINGAGANLGTNQTVYMRGAGSGRALILLDGIPVYDPSLINSEFDLNFLSVYDVERIEICRGAQSTLYGSDAVAGVINIITTPKDQVKTFNVKALQTIGNYGTYRSNLQLFGQKKKIRYSTRFSNISSNGFSSARDTVGNKNFDNDYYRGRVAGASLQYDVSKSFNIKAYGQYSHYKNAVDGGAFADDRDYLLTNKNLLSGLRMQYQRGKASLNLNYQFSQTQRGYLNDSGHVSGFSTFEKTNFKGKTNFMEAYGSFKLASQLTLIAGMDFRAANMNSDYLSISAYGPYASAFEDKNMHQWSAYTSLVFASAKTGFNAEAGMRYNRHSEYGDNFTYTLNPSYRIDNNWRVFASVATGFKAPSLYQLYAGPDIGNTALDPETSVSYEAGFQYVKKQFSARVVYYYRNTDNGIDYRGYPADPSGYFNFINQVGKGIEMELAYGITEKLSVAANYSLMMANETTPSRLNAKDTSYSYLLRRPKHQFNIRLAYDFSPKFNVNAGLRYAGDRYDAGGYLKNDLNMKAYAVVNLYGVYKLNAKCKLFADVQNVFNTKFSEAVGFNGIPVMTTAGVSIQL